MSMASADEMAAMAMESQAQRSVKLVQGLQNDIAERDTMIEKYRSRNNELSAENETYKSQNEQLTTRIAENEKALQAAANQAAEARVVADDQIKLTQRLMDVNARLSANQKI